MNEKYIALAVLIVSVLILIILMIRFFYLKRKKPDIGRIYKTTDGFLANNPANRKSRNIAVVDQRTDDQAVAVVKIYSKKGKDGKNCIRKVVLKPSDHTVLTEDSIVGQRVIIGRKDGTSFQVIHSRDLTSTDDHLTKNEYSQIRKGIGGPTKKNQKSTKKKLRRWHKHFRK